MKIKIFQVTRPAIKPFKFKRYDYLKRFHIYVVLLLPTNKRTFI